MDSDVDYVDEMMDDSEASCSSGGLLNTLRALVPSELLIAESDELVH